MIDTDATTRARIPDLIRTKGWITLALMFYLLVPKGVQGQQLEYTHDRPPTIDELLNVKETFVYEVKYSFFKLGKITVEVVGDTVSRGYHAYHLKTIIRSNPSIPFMGKEENHYNSLMVAEKLPFSTVFWTDNVDEDEYDETRYVFDREKKKVYTFEMHEPQDTLDLVEPASSGHITFYFSRLFAGSDRGFSIPIYINHKKGKLTGYNTTDTTMRTYDALSEDPIPTFKMEGDADLEGPFGFRGKFTSWFSADDLRIPLEAHVKVWLGHVKVRLIKYTRTANPPWK